MLIVFISFKRERRKTMHHQARKQPKTRAKEEQLTVCLEDCGESDDDCFGGWRMEVAFE